MKKRASIFILPYLLLAGCDEYSEAKKAVENSAFYRENLASVKQFNSQQVIYFNSHELWIGKVKQHNENGLIFEESNCIESIPLGLWRSKCSISFSAWDKYAYPFFKTGDIVVLVINHNMKGHHDVFLDRIAKIEKTDALWRVVPQKFKQYRKTYYASNVPYMVYAGTERSQFIVGESVILKISLQNVRDDEFIQFVETHPMRDFNIVLTDVGTGKIIPPLNPVSDEIFRRIMIQIKPWEVKNFEINLSEKFGLNEIGNYAISLSGTDLNGNKFQLDTIEFEVRSKEEVTITDKRLIDIGKPVSCEK